MATFSDNKVSVDEWKHMWYTSMGNVNQDDLQWQQLYLDYVFRLFDTSSDGMIDISEFIEAMAYYGIDKRHATWAFDKFARVRVRRWWRTSCRDQKGSWCTRSRASSMKRCGRNTSPHWTRPSRATICSATCSATTTRSR